jgi:hypothetical protein
MNIVKILWGDDCYEEINFTNMTITSAGSESLEDLAQKSKTTMPLSNVPQSHYWQAMLDGVVLDTELTLRQYVAIHYPELLL